MEFEIINKIFENEKPKSIFEVGVTAGLLFQSYAEKNNIVVGGMDIHPVGAAKEIYPKYADNFIQWDATKVPWPIPDDSYDIVFTVGTILSIPNPYPVIKEMLRICKDKIIIAEHHNELHDDWGQKRNFITAEIRNVPAYANQEKGYYDWRIERDYEKVFQNLNLKYKIKGILIDKTIFSCKK